MPDGRSYVVTLRKGGVGKTTMAMNLALFLRQAGRNVAFLDLDSQRDGFDFFRDRKRLYPDLPEVVPLALEDPDQVQSAMRSVVAAGGDIVVDCPPSDPPHVLRAQECADVLLFPFRAGGNDLRAFSRALALYQTRLERARSARCLPGGPEMYAVLNEYMPGQVNDRLLLKWIQGSGVFELAGCLGRRVEFKDAVAKRQALWEYAPGSKSANEIVTVCQALSGSRP